MTEITANKEKVRYAINPWKFVVALILAPILVTALTCWTLIGLYALPFGAIPYLVIGTPILIWAAGRIKPAFWPYAGLGLLGWVVMMVVLPLALLAEGNAWEIVDMMRFLGGFGLIFAPLYAGAFGWLYGALEPDPRVLNA